MRTDVRGTRSPRVTRLGVTILFTDRPARMVGFYRAIGVPLVEETHEGGPLHWACDVRGIHFAIFASRARRNTRQASRHRSPGSTMIGVYVDSLPKALRAVRRLRARVVRGPERRPWGRRIVVLDPDGRGVEITQPP
ncbi:MAG TPA: VOC family protein [Thermoplasmata archaeon]|nr:VOC family protein [Thermoplasmata archaeon]